MRKDKKEYESYIQLLKELATAHDAISTKLFALSVVLEQEGTVSTLTRLQKRETKRIREEMNIQKDN